MGNISEHTNRSGTSGGFAYRPRTTRYGAAALMSRVSVANFSTKYMIEGTVY